MTPEDRELLLSLRRQQGELQQSLERLTGQLSALEIRAGAIVAEISLPPLPTEPQLPPLPALPSLAATELALPPLPVIDNLAPKPPVPTSPRPSFEFQFGRWLIRMGALFAVIALALILAWPKVQDVLGHAGLLAISAAVSVFVVILGNRLERKGAGSLVFGRAITAMALAWLYLTAYTAYFYEPMRVIGGPLVAGLLLLLWSIYVLLLAERKKSQSLSLFAIALAYLGTAINPVGYFTMAADLILAATAVLFLLRNGWAALSFFSLLGTYGALLRRLVVDENGELILDTSRTLHFLPYAAYLTGAWLMFTTAVIFTCAPTFRGAKRFAFLTLNNAAVAVLLPLTAYIVGYDYGAIGWTLLDAGLVFLITSRFAGFAEIDPVEVMAAYAAQGLALVTAGIIVVYTGITRAVVLLTETFLLGVAGAFAGDRILTINTYIAGFFATLFLIWEIAVHGHHPWLFGFGGALVMLINAWSSRGEVRHSPVERSTIVLSSSCYCALALGLIFTTLSTEMTDRSLPPALALAAMVLTFSIYYYAIFELPPMAQTLLLAAQGLVLFPIETGEELPWWSTAWVAAITLLLVTWWSRQRVTRTGPWTVALTFVYALALVGLAYQTVRPYVDAQGWIIGASLLSVAFLVWGAFTRVWSLAAMGQLFLAVAVYHFLVPPGSGDFFPWTWGTAVIPIAVVFATAQATQKWLQLFPEIPAAWSQPLNVLAYGYRILALGMLVRWVFSLTFIPAFDQMAAFLFLGTLVLSTNVRHRSSFGVRCSFVLSAIGLWLYLDNLGANAREMATFLNGFALFLFLAQSPLLRHEGKLLVTSIETWFLLLLSVGTSWLFVSAWILTRLNSGYLTMGWALYALFLFLFGLLPWEKRLRWCGLAVVVAAILRVMCFDMWSLSSGYRVLTFIVLAFITLGIGYSILRRADRRTSA